MPVNALEYGADYGDPSNALAQDYPPWAWSRQRLAHAVAAIRNQQSPSGSRDLTNAIQNWLNRFNTPQMNEGEMPPVMSPEDAFRFQQWPAIQIPNNNQGAPVAAQPLPQNQGQTIGSGAIIDQYTDARMSPAQRILYNLRLYHPGMDI